MKIAILGAGLSGLSCAKYLEDHGVEPVIFEKRHRVGERFPNMEAIIRLMHRPIDDPLTYLNKRYGLKLVPGGVMHTLEIHSPNHKAALKDKIIGYTTIRGHDERSLENQLARQVRAGINFNSTVTWQELDKDFDRIVIATGDPTITRELGIWQTDSEAFLKGCIVKGKFDTGLAKIWLNTGLSKNCMVYFAPFDADEASYCTVATPSSPEELDGLWSQTVEKLGFRPVQGTEFKYEEFKMGRALTRQFGKILLVGAAGGFVEPFMGFGQVPSILSGLHAGEAIISGKDFNKLTAWFTKQYSYCLALRKFADTLDNEGFDRLVSFIGAPLVTGIMTNTNFPLLGPAAGAVRSKNLLTHPFGQKNNAG